MEQLSSVEEDRVHFSQKCEHLITDVEYSEDIQAEEYQCLSKEQAESVQRILTRQV